MRPPTIVHDRALRWAILGLTAAYMLTFAVAFPPSDAIELLVVECMFAGPMMIACALPMVITRTGVLRMALGFQVAYILFTVMMFISTFSGEQDAQY